MTATMSLTGKVSIVTGAGSGIGREIAVAFAKEGSKVTIADINKNDLEVTADLMKKAGAKDSDILQCHVDLLKSEDCENMIRSTVEKFNKIDILMNVAGVFLLANFVDTTLEDFDRLFSLNVRAVFYISKLALPHLIQTKGNIVNISSTASTMNTVKAALYSLTKATVDQMTRTLALEVAPQGVRVNSVNPGPLHTNIYKSGGLQEKSISELLRDSAAKTPLGSELVKMEDLVNASLFLVSDKASVITGNHIIVDGGIRL